MGFDIRWIKEGHLFVVDFIEPVVDDEAQDFNDAINDYFDSSSRLLVHGIFDFTRSSSIFTIKRMARFTFPKHPRMGWNVFVAMPNKQVAFFVSIATQIFKVRVRTVATLEEALEFIHYIDQTIAVN
jgi:hypothetical protein